MLADHKVVVAVDTSAKSVVHEQAVIPENLVTYFCIWQNPTSILIQRQTSILMNQMRFLFQNPQARLNITGYTDAVGSDEYNQALGYRRALSTQH